MRPVSQQVLRMFAVVKRQLRQAKTLDMYVEHFWWGLKRVRDEREELKEKSENASRKWVELVAYHNLLREDYDSLKSAYDEHKAKLADIRALTERIVKRGK